MVFVEWISEVMAKSQGWELVNHIDLIITDAHHREPILSGPTGTETGHLAEIDELHHYPATVIILADVIVHQDVDQERLHIAQETDHHFEI